MGRSEDSGTLIRLGLIGCGKHSESGHAIPLARYMAAHPDEVCLTAVCDLQIERALEFCGKYSFSAAYRNVDEMLVQEKLDGCIAVVPPAEISALGIKLLNHGVPCVVEKPLGITFAEVHALRDSSAATHTPNMVSVNRRFMPSLNGAAEWARSVGDLRYVRCTLARHDRTEPEFIWTTAVHAVDAFRYIAGEVHDFDVHVLKTNSASTDWYAIDLKFVNGISGRIDVLPTAGMVEETYELIGDGFRASVTCPFGRHRGWSAFRDGHLVSEEFSEGIPEDIFNGCYNEGAAFIQALNSESAPGPTISEVAPSVTVCMAIAEKIGAELGR